MDGIYKSQSLRKTANRWLLFYPLAPGIYARSYRCSKIQFGWVEIISQGCSSRYLVWWKTPGNFRRHCQLPWLVSYNRQFAFLRRLYLRIGRETSTINVLRTIHQNQATFYATNSRFATLGELAAFGLLDPHYASGRHVYGYVYSSSDVTAETYCVHADRINDKCGHRDFIVCEDGIIRYNESNIRGTVKRDEGKALSESGAAVPNEQFPK